MRAQIRVFLNLPIADPNLNLNPDPRSRLKYTLSSKFKFRSEMGVLKIYEVEIQAINEYRRDDATKTGSNCTTIVLTSKQFCRVHLACMPIKERIEMA